MRGISER
jgi:hypothetical protein